MPVERAKVATEGYGMPADETLTRLRFEIVAGCAVEVAEIAGALLAYVDADDKPATLRVLTELRQAYRSYVNASLSGYGRIQREYLRDGLT